MKCSFDYLYINADIYRLYLQLKIEVSNIKFAYDRSKEKIYRLCLISK